MYLRTGNKLIIVGALVAIFADVMRPYPNPWVLIFSLLAILLAIIGGLERHEREERRARGREWIVTNTENGRSARLRELDSDTDEARRRRGAAGWQKPVRPPSPGSRPGGLPPRRDR